MLDTLWQILSELEHYKRPKQQLKTFYIQKRLQESLISYYDEISKSLEYLKYKDCEKVARSM